MDVKNEAKNAAKKGAELWAAKKGVEWTGSLLKVAACVGAGYLAYKYIKKHDISCGSQMI